MNEIINNLQNSELIKLVGGLSVVIGVVFGFIGSFLRDLMNHKLDSNNQKEIESIKSQLSKNETLIANTSTLLSNAYTSSNQLVLEHYQKLWNGILTIKKCFPASAFLAYTILTKEEFLDLSENPKLIDKDLLKIDYERDVFELNKILERVEESRPFVGAYAWNLFYVYRSIHGRLELLLSENLKGKRKIYWLDDEPYLSHILGIVVQANKINELVKNRNLAFNNIKAYLEIEFQNEVQNQIFGKKASTETINQAIEISKTLEKNV